MLPDGFLYRICAYKEDGDGFTATIRLPLKTKEAAVEWQTAFKDKSTTTMRVLRTYPGSAKKNVYRVSRRIGLRLITK